MRILIVDDEPNIRKTLRLALSSVGHSVEEAADVAEAMKRIEQSQLDLAFVDLRLGQESGFKLLETIPQLSPRVVVVIMTAYATIDNAVDAMRRGAFDYLPKPFTPAQIRAVVERVERMRSLRDRLTDLEDQLGREIPEVSLESRRPTSSGCFGSRSPGRGDRRGCPDPWRKRDGQGRACAGHPCLEPASRSRSS